MNEQVSDTSIPLLLLCPIFELPCGFDSTLYVSFCTKHSNRSSWLFDRIAFFCSGCLAMTDQVEHASESPRAVAETGITGIHFPVRKARRRLENLYIHILS